MVVILSLLSERVNLKVGTNHCPWCLSYRRLPAALSTQPREDSRIMLTLVLFSSLAFITLLQETETHFNDLGKLLLGGVAAAIVFAVAFTFVRLRLRDKNPQPPSFISISAPVEKNEE